MQTSINGNWFSINFEIFMQILFHANGTNAYGLNLTHLQDH